jgi:thioesterase domain-containing protein
MTETVQDLSPAKAELLRRLRSDRPATGPVPLRPGSGSPTLVLVHPVGGALFCYAALTAALRSSSPVYGFADAGEETGDGPEQRIPRLASRYLAELREADVPRPWLLGGWSFGGVVAYEMARQDGDVANVLLLDAAYVSDDEAAAAPEPVVRRWFVRDIARLAGVPEERIADDPGEKELEELVGLGPDELSERYRIFEANSRGLLAYRPGPYRGVVTLVLAEESPDVSGEWAQHVSGRIDSHFVPGDHYELLSGSSVELVARIVDDLEAS